VIVAVLRFSLAVVVLTVVALVCAAAVVVGLLHPRLTPAKALDALGQFNHEAARLISPS
jgi:hypothetical protein